MRPFKKTGAVLFACLLCSILTLSAADQAATEAKNSPVPPATSEIEQLRQILADQQRQINELRLAVAQQQKNAGEADIAASASSLALAPAKAPVSTFKRLGEVASTTAVLPRPVALPAVSALPATPAHQAAPVNPATDSSPLQVKIGDAYITPVGFMDMTLVSRSTNAGNALATNFGSIPFANTTKGALTETRLTAQNSRIGLRVDALVKGVNVLGYLESDFVGFTPTNVAVSTNSDSLRLRQYFVQLNKGKFEFLAGQAWGMETPNRVGISPLPANVFITQDIDVNYQAGLVFTRQSGFRVLYHPNSKVVFGVALENPEQYIGGSGGGGITVLPAAFTSLQVNQLNDGTANYNVPNLHPDIVGKIAFDPSPKFHLELVGIERTFKIANPTTLVTNTKAGGAGAINLGIEIFKGFRVLTNNYWGAGGGRYIFGLAPDLILRADGSISSIHSGSTLSGFEYTHKTIVFYALYGGVYIQRNTAIDTNGKLVGYGYSGSSNGQNRAIQEGTFGINQTLMRDPRWGAVNLMFQYSYLQRNPWFVAPGQPTDANVQMGFVNVRYTLPGSAPTLGR
jgi:hypothetical protein